MGRALIAIALTLSFLCAYSPMWTAKLFSLVVGNEGVFVSRENWMQLRKACGDVAGLSKNCTEAYVVRGAAFDEIKSKFPTSVAHGLGQLSGAAIWSCLVSHDGHLSIGERIAHEGDESGARIRTGYYSYVIGAFDPRPCKDGLVVEISADSTNLNRRSGWLRGLVAFYDSKNIEKYRDIYNFFNNEVRLVIAILLWFCLFILVSTERMQQYIRVVHYTNSSMIWLFLYLILSSGRLEHFLIGLSPIIKVCQPAAYITLMFSTFSRFLVSLRARVLVECAFFISHLIVLGLFSAQMSSIYRLEMVPLVLVALAFVFRHRDWTSLPFLLLYLHDYVLLLYPAAEAFPSSALIYLAVYCMLQVLQQLRYASVFISLREVELSSAEDPIRKYFGYMSKLVEELGIEYSSIYCPIGGSDGGTIVSCSEGGEEVSVSLEKIPPFFGYVKATRESLTHVDVGGQFYNSLKQQYGTGNAIDLRGGESRWFSVYCVDFDNEQFLVSFSRYPSFYVKSAFGRRIFAVIVNVVIEGFVKSLRASQLKKADSFARVVSEADAMIASGKLLDGVGVLDYFASVNSLSYFVISVDPKSFVMELVHSHNYDDHSGIQGLFNQRALNPKNLIGPLANSFFNDKVTVISDGRTLLPFSSKLVSDFISNSGANSIVCFPVSLGGGESKTVVWIQSSQVGRFNAGDKESFSVLMKLLDNLYVASSLERLTQVVTEILPDDALKAYQEKGEYSSVECGWILMFDLKKSTELSAEVGYSEFDRLMLLAQDTLLSAMKDFGWSLKERTWDAFYFFKHKSEEVNDMDLSFISQLLRELAASDSLRSRGVALNFRALLHSGDLQFVIVREGALKFKMVGAAMAELSKLEAIAKTVQSDLFVSSEANGSSFLGAKEVGHVNLGRKIELFAFDHKYPDRKTA